MRSTITDHLRDVRFVRMVDADEVRADLDTIVAISAIGHPGPRRGPSAFEMRMRHRVAAIKTHGAQWAQLTVPAQD